MTESEAMSNNDVAPSGRNNEKKKSGNNNRRRRKPKPASDAGNNSNSNSNSNSNNNNNNNNSNTGVPNKRNTNDEGPRQKKQKKIIHCRDFAKGDCRFGPKCRFVHTATPGEEEDRDTSTTETSVQPMDVDVKDDQHQEKMQEETPVATVTSTHITDKRFADLRISSQSKRAMKEIFKYEFMTVVQAETLPTILQGNDCLARAKTGTGKTLGFLIPAVEFLRKQHSNRNDIECLILSPTRELAFQIQTEAKSLTQFHKLKSVAFVGGTTISKDHRALKDNLDILVATPGRLLDHLQNGLAQRLHNMKVLIFDECDQLLDQGFRPDIMRILNLLNPSKDQRQTLLFSATVPDSVSEIADLALKSDYSYIDTVGDDEDQTHLHVRQDLLVAPQAEQFHAIESILASEMTEGMPYKIIVFFTTARLTGFMADLFNSVQDRLGYTVLEIHSRKSQAVRKRASDKFRTAKRAVLFSSDVSARGMDYPDVTFVLQVGLTERAQYIHRLGRTARAGKKGKGALLLAPYEEAWMRSQLKDLPLKPCPVPPRVNYALDQALSAVSKDKELGLSAKQAYRVWLGFYNAHSKKFKWDKPTLVIHANKWSTEAGLKDLPSFQKKTIGKMGLKNVRGLRID